MLTHAEMLANIRDMVQDAQDALADILDDDEDVLADYAVDRANAIESLALQLQETFSEFNPDVNIWTQG